jgi:hypothetical protein
MKMLAALVLCAAAVCAGLARAEDAPAKAETAGVEGEVLDMACDMGYAASGPKHAKCAKACVLGGSPMGLLKADGSVLLLVDDHGKEKAYAAVKELAGGKAKVTGTLAKRAGITALIVQKAEKAAAEKKAE